MRREHKRFCTLNLKKLLEFFYHEIMKNSLNTDTEYLMYNLINLIIIIYITTYLSILRINDFDRPTFSTPL